MSYEIFFSPRSLKEYEYIIEYIVSGFGVQKAIEVEGHFDIL